MSTKSEQVLAIPSLRQLRLNSFSPQSNSLDNEEISRFNYFMNTIIVVILINQQGRRRNEQDWNLEGNSLPGAKNRFGIRNGSRKYVGQRKVVQKLK